MLCLYFRNQQLAGCLGDIRRRVQRNDGVKLWQDVWEDWFDLVESTSSTDCWSQHCRLHDSKEQHCHQLQGVCQFIWIVFVSLTVHFLSYVSLLSTFISPTGHESHKLLWHHPWSSVCVIHCTVLWTGYGSAGVGFTEGQWNGRSSTDAKWLSDFPGCADREPASHQIVLQIHWQSAHFLQVTVHIAVCFNVRISEVTSQTIRV